MNSAAGQLVFKDLSFPEERTLRSFIGVGNEETLRRLEGCVQKSPEFRLMWLAGASGSGKTHLAEALCRQAGVWPSGYFSKGGWSDSSREPLYAQLPLMVVDRVELLFGEARREQWLAFVIDTRKRTRLPTLLVAQKGPAHCQCALKDLRTRFGLAEVLALESLPDETKLRVMTEFAKMKGFALGEEVLNFLLRRHNRNLGRLIELLREIDRRSLRAKRPVTVPFVREILRQSAGDAG